MLQARHETLKAVSNLRAARKLLVTWFVLKSASNVAQDFLFDVFMLSAMLYPSPLWIGILGSYP